MGYDPNELQVWSLGRAPSYGDDAYFDGAYSNAGVTVGVIGPWNSIHLINGFSYHRRQQDRPQPHETLIEVASGR